jgi:hypothetical protein
MRRRMRRRMIIGGMVVLGVGYGAYKLTQSQVQQVEQKTGKKAEDLSEEELEGAMDELGIEAQEPTDEEIAMLEAADETDDKSETQAASQGKTDEETVMLEVENEPDEKSATPTASQGKTDVSYLDELERLASFRDQGIITHEEFDAKKKDLLGL